MTETELEPFAATIGDNPRGNYFRITVKSEDEDTPVDYSCAPGIDITIETRSEQLSVSADEALSEEDTLALIDALTKALERSREYAKARGYYDWVAEGKPDYDTFADEEPDRT